MTKGLVALRIAVFAVVAFTLTSPGAYAQVGIISTYAGFGHSYLDSGDGGPATSASLAHPSQVALDSSGNLYIADVNGSRVRRVDAISGIISTVAGGGTGGDGGLATAASLTNPCGVALDSAGNIFIAESCLQASGGGGAASSVMSRVRRVDAITGIITTIAGGVIAGYGGDGGPAAAATLNTPGGLAVDGSGNLYIADAMNHRVRRVDAITGIITSVAGVGIPSFGGDGGPATSAYLNQPVSVAVDGNGNVFVSDTGNQRIRRVDAVSGIISTVAGTGIAGFNGDGIAGYAATLNLPLYLCVDSLGNLIFSEGGSKRVRIIEAATGLIWTVAGNGSAAGADNLPATSAGLSFPTGVTGGGNGPLYIADEQGDNVRRVALPGNLTSTALNMSSPTSVPSNSPVTLTGTLIAHIGTAAGAGGGMGFYDTFNGSTSYLGGAAVVNGSGSLSVTFGSLGTHMITATYFGDPAFGSSASGTWPVTVTRQQPSVTLTSTPNPATDTQGITLSAAVSNFPTGTVSFLNGATQIGSAAVVNGVAAVSGISLSAGTYSLTAQYNGDTYNAPATSAAITQRVQTSSTASLSAAPNPANVGQTVALTAAVVPAGATGAVQFLDGGAVIGSANIGNGSATIQTSGLTAGAHSLTAVYGGDTNTLGSTARAISIVVRAASTVGVSSSLNPANSGQAVTLTATVTPTATGTIQFFDGGAALGTGTLASGSTSLTVSTLSSGSHAITAVYSGDANTSGSTSSAITQVVKVLSTLVLTSSANPANPGQSVTFAVSVTPATAIGAVQFFDGAVAVGSGTLATGTTSLTLNTLSAGTHSITAVYGGDGSTAGSTSAAVSQLIRVASAVGLASSANPSNPGQSVTFTAMVSPSAATGTAQFFDGVSSIGSATLTSGVASLSSAALASGSHSITAVFSGDANTAGSTSAAVLQSVRIAAGVTLASSVNPSTVGQALTLTATVTPAAGTGTVQFRDGATVLATQTVAAGAATYTTTLLTKGAHSLTAVYSGDAGYTAATSAVLTQTVNLPIPAAPSALSATAAGSTLVNLAWSASATSGVNYSVYASTTAGFTPSSASRIATGVAGVTYAAPGLSASTTYYFKVTAVNSSGESTPSNQASAATSGGGLSCKVNYTVTNQWNVGFGTAITIQNSGSTAINGWTLTWTWPGTQAITQSWNSTYAQTGANATMRNASWNASIAAGATLSGMGFNASYSGTNAAPAAFYLNGVQCR